LKWDFNEDSPIYLQIIEQIQLRIVTGVYSPGLKLTSVRDLAKEAAVNPNTMQRALTELETSKLIYSKRTAGRFVTEDLDLILVVKKRLAQEKLNDFLLNMSKLGYSSEEVFFLLKETMNIEGDK